MKEKSVKFFGKMKNIRKPFFSEKAAWDAKKAWNEMQKKGIRFISCEDTSYPQKLKEIYDYPFGLFIRGELPKENEKTVAIVGARLCSAYGRHFAVKIAEELAGYDISLVSGMARGIDGTAQRAVIKGGGKSYAVLGCGPDICYPMQNRDLYQNLLKKWRSLIGISAGKQSASFSSQCEIALSVAFRHLVIVIEAREKSGSLITADQALEQGRDVMVLPGRAGDALSAGCNRLIDQGAGIFLSTDQILERLKIKKKNHTNTKKTYIALESEENLVYSVLEFQAKNLQSIADETNLTPQKVSAILVRLMLCGLVAEDVKNHYSKV